MALALECESSPATITDLAQGRSKEPRYALGCALDALHRSGKSPPSIKKAKA